jgi:hypothetical protein
MRNLDVAPAKLPHELHVMVAGDNEGVTGRDHLHDKSQYVRNAWTAIDEVTDENDFAPGGM